MIVGFVCWNIWTVKLEYIPYSRDVGEFEFYKNMFGFIIVQFIIGILVYY